VAEYIQKEYPETSGSTIIESETANSAKKIETIFSNMNLAPLRKGLQSSVAGEAELEAKQGDLPKVFIGTSILTTPPKNIKFDLVIFLNADLGLNIPDYTSSEKNFYFLYDAFTKYDCASFIVQSFNPDQYSIRSACKLDKP
jgi:primosomal protein N'